MRSAILASLAPLLALAACAGAPPEQPPGPVKTAAPVASVAPPPNPCDEAGSLLASAKAALDEGRLLRARRWLSQASARCPSRAGETLALDLRTAVALNDADAIARLKSAAAGAPDTPALRDALANDAPFGGDVPKGIAPSANSLDYYRAAQAFVEGKLDEAGRGAMSVVLSGSGPLLGEAFVLAARVAEALGDVPRANRMFSRAFQAACGSGCEAPVYPPREEYFSLAAAYPGIRLAEASCLPLVGRDPKLRGPAGGALTPDGRFYVTNTASDAEVRSVPERILMGRIPVGSHEQGMSACFSDKALFYVLYRLDQRDRVFVAPLGGEARAITGPRLWIEARFKLPIVTASGTVYVPNNLDFDGGREWYRAALGDRALKRLPVPFDEFDPALLPSGELIGFEKPPAGGDQKRMLAVFDGTTGKRRRLLGRAPDGFRFVVSPDGQRLVYHLWGKKLGVVDLSSEGPGGERKEAARVPQEGTAQVRTVEVQKLGSLQGIVDASRVIVRDDERHFAVADLVKGNAESAAITAGPIHRAEVRGGRLLVQIGDNLVALYASDGRISHNEPGVSFKEPPSQRAPGWDRMRPLPRCSSDFVSGEGAAWIYLCSDNSVWRDHPDTQAPATRLGDLPPVTRGAKLKSWDESEGFFFAVTWDELMIGEILDTRVEGLRIRFAQGAMGGIAIDGKGYYEFFGEVPDAFRKSAACGDTMPIEACADLYEAPGMARRFIARDFSYRGP